MITRIFSAPIGCGIRKLLVAPLAAQAAIDAIKGTTRKITVIVANDVMGRQFKRDLPSADYITPIKWLRRAADDETDLVIVDELGARLPAIIATLQRIPNEVWLVNPWPTRINTGHQHGPDLIGIDAGGRYIERDMGARA